MHVIVLVRRAWDAILPDFFRAVDIGDRHVPRVTHRARAGPGAAFPRTYHSLEPPYSTPFSMQCRASACTLEGGSSNRRVLLRQPARLDFDRRPDVS